MKTPENMLRAHAMALRFRSNAGAGKWGIAADTRNRWVAFMSQDVGADYIRFMEPNVSANRLDTIHRRAETFWEDFHVIVNPGEEVHHA